MSSQVGAQESEAPGRPTSPGPDASASGASEKGDKTSSPSTHTNDSSAHKDTSVAETTKNGDKSTASASRPGSPSPDSAPSKSNGKDHHSRHTPQSSLESLEDDEPKAYKKSALDLLDYVTYWERIQIGLARGT